MIKKKQLQPLLLNLLQINADNGAPIGGLLMEKLSLGLKRRLVKIREELLNHYEQLQRDAEEVKATYEADGRKIQEELDILYNETISVSCEPALMSEIEKVETEKLYDFDLLELISK